MLIMELRRLALAEMMMTGFRRLQETLSMVEENRDESGHRGFCCAIGDGRRLKRRWVEQTMIWYLLKSSLTSTLYGDAFQTSLPRHFAL